MLYNFPTDRSPLPNYCAMAAALREHDSDDDVLDLGSVVPIRNRSRVSSVCLVEKVISDRAINSFVVIDVMTKSFRAKQKSTTREWGNGMILFSFESPADRDRVVGNQPWHFNDMIFAIKPLLGSEQPSSIQITVASF